MSDDDELPFAGINRTVGPHGAMTARVPTAAEVAEACKPQPWRSAPPVPVSSETYERMRSLMSARADLAAIYANTPPMRNEGATAELVDGVVEIRDADGNLLAVASEEAFEAVCAKLTP